MAKAQFRGTKPSITVARSRLLQAGMSGAGIEQLLNGQPLTNANDRKLVARIVVSHIEEGGKFVLTSISHSAREPVY